MTILIPYKCVKLMSEVGNVPNVASAYQLYIKYLKVIIKIIYIFQNITKPISKSVSIQ